jgi:hypothetical protein
MPDLRLAQTFRIRNPLGVEDLGQLVQRLADQLANLAIPVAVVLYIYAGFQFLSARGNPERIAKAKKTMLYTTIGLAVIFIGGGFVDLIRSLLNLGQ